MEPVLRYYRRNDDLNLKKTLRLSTFFSLVNLAC
jgi:hypothetical protein